MNKKRLNIILFCILILAFFSLNLSEPKYFNKSVDFLNARFGQKLPHFWNMPFKLGLDLQGGTHLVYEADLANIEKKDYSSAMQGLRDIIERRVNLFGVTEPVVQVEGGGNRLVVELAGIKDSQQAIQMIGQTPFLEFRKERPEEQTQKILDKRKEIENKTIEEVQKIPDWELALQDPYFESTDLTGKYLDAAKTDLGFEPNTQKPMILLQFNNDGAKIFEDLTSQNVGKRIAIYLDGNLLSAPNVQEKITGGRAQITGNFTVKEAQDLVRNLKSGALPVPIKLISQQSVGPTLGAVSLQKSLQAGLYGFLAVVIFMLVFYRLPGFFASLALVIYTAIILSIFKLIPVTLTLAGIGGFVLSIGMAVDANILIFARMREEIKQGKNLTLAISEGFKRAWPSIRDSNLNSLIICAILFTFATSFIKGFALTLALGILASMFSAIFITRVFLLFFIRPKLEKFKWIL